MTDPDQLPALPERSVIRQFLIDYWEGDGDQSMAHSMIFAPSDFEAVRRCVSSFAQQVDWLQQQCDERAELKAKLETAEASLLSAKQPLRAEMAALNKRVTEQNRAIATERARADALQAELDAEKETTANLVRALREATESPTFMGEPVLPPIYARADALEAVLRKIVEPGADLRMAMRDARALLEKKT